VIFRVQDSDGRGPYRLGFSRFWVDDDGPANAPWWTEIGVPIDVAHAWMDDDHHWGCGFSTIDQFCRWFSPAERARLDRFGYILVLLNPDRVIATTPTQVVFGCKRPLRDAVEMRVKLSAKLAIKRLAA